MKRLCAFILTLLQISVVSALNRGPCFEGILEVATYVDEEYLSCAFGKVEASPHVHYLCAGESKELSPEFATYLSYHREYELLGERVRVSTDARERLDLMRKFQHLKTDWTLFGYEAEVAEHLWPLSNINQCK